MTEGDDHPARHRTRQFFRQFFEPGDVEPIGLYMLDEQRRVIRAPDVLTWGRWMESPESLALRRVAQDRDEGPDGREIWISTMFLGLDHNHFGDGPPIVWETMVFGGPLDGTQDRYCTLDGALAGHQAICQRVTLALQLERERS